MRSGGGREKQPEKEEGKEKHAAANFFRLVVPLQSSNQQRVLIAFQTVGTALVAQLALKTAHRRPDSSGQSVPSFRPPFSAPIFSSSFVGCPPFTGCRRRWRLRLFALLRAVARALGNNRHIIETPMGHRNDGP